MHRVDEFRKLFYRNRAVVERGEFEGMWSTVTPCNADSPAPSARSKHSATLLCGHVYLLGGRNGNVPLKDFWKYNLSEGTWQQLQPSGDRLPCLQEHTAVPYRDSIYVFGGEVGFSAGTETPLWVYDVKQNVWRKVRARKGVQVPRGRRGHTALVHRGTMLIYGGYQDLRGSCTELWAFHFETESWHLISSSGGRSTGDPVPPARHKHSAIMHEDSMWVYGGMTDLQERADLWRWDTVSKTWTGYKLKHTPGPLHSHAACRLPSSMVLFGGERDGHPTNDLWKFHFDTGAWEKLIVNGLRPQARAECVAFAVSELLLKDTSGTSLETRMARTRSRTMHSSNTTATAAAATAAKPSSYIPHNRVSPYEKTYVFKPTQGNYTDGSDPSHTFTDTAADNTRSQAGGFLREITKLSQLNLSRLNHTKCSYTVLATGNNDSTESLLRQHSSGVHDTDSESSTPNRMIKSRSAYAIKKKYNEREPSSTTVQETCIDSTTLRNTRLNTDPRRMTRDPISVPNFGALARQAPALTPVEAARLVFLDTDDEDDDDDDNDEHCKNNIDCTGTKVIHVQSYSSPKKCHVYENFKSVKRGESYNSHLGYADNPLYAVKFGKCTELEEVSDETSDYASIETMNRLSSSSSYTYSYSTASHQQTPQDTAGGGVGGGEITSSGTGGVAVFRAKGNGNKVQVADGPFGFCNPNYMGPDIQLLLSSDNKKQQYAKLLNTPDSVLEDALGRSTSRHMFLEENLELQNMVNSETTRHGRHKSATVVVPPKSLELADMTPSSKPTKRHMAGGKCRASSASRVERHSTNNSNSGTTGARRGQMVGGASVDAPPEPPSDVYVPLYVFIVGGKEQGQVTVFKRPISIWKLKLF